MNERTNKEWQDAIAEPVADEAITDLRAILLRGLRYALTNHRVTEADLEDFVQDGLLRILREVASFRGDAHFTTWAQKVAVRVALTELRRRRWRDVPLEDVIRGDQQSDFTPSVLISTDQEPGRRAILQMMIEMVQRLIAEELTERQREAMMAIMVGGMPMQEVAERMGTNRNALYKLLHDGRKRLQTRMMNEGLSVDELLTMFDEV
jgi:RNA polymerase sigma-70 factor (ECF subfamily)